ncbi:MAG: hypothetical protein H0V54_04835 [Chthoniobacterales bacterium]|nr:hypothetical protein [Chthoniobacterales bacterium]
MNVQLIRAENDAHIWADTYDRKLTDIFAVETGVRATDRDLAPVSAVSQGPHPNLERWHP